MVEMQINLLVKENAFNIDDVKKTLVKIEIEDENKIGSGFFCYIGDNSSKIPVLVTNNHVIDLNHLKTGKTIKISNDTDEEQEIEIKENTRRFTNKCLDITIIEIEKEKENLFKFLEVDDKETEDTKDISILHHPEGEDANLSIKGKILFKDNFDIKYKCTTKSGSSGGAIIRSDNYKVIGVHKSKIGNNLHAGTLINFAIKSFFKMNKTIYKNIKRNDYEYEGELTKDDKKEGYGWCKSDNYIYIGEYENDKRNRYGTLLEIADKKIKIVYDGYWKDDHEHGNGKRFLPDGKIEIGEWENGKLKNKKIIDPNEEQNDEIKTGSLKNNRKIVNIILVAIFLILIIFLIKYFNSSNVNTKILLGECVHYEGKIKDGKKNGYGTCKYDNGDEYKGNWKNNVREGKGILTWANGNKYNGEWKNDTINGQGEVTLTNGNKYKGEFKNDSMNVTYTNEDKYNGKYNGEFKEGLLHGYGTFTYVNGDIYVGEWKNDNRDGYGIYTYSNGDKYNGNWKNDNKDGCGKLIKANGKVDYDGFWENDEKVGWWRNLFNCR